MIWVSGMCHSSWEAFTWRVRRRFCLRCYEWSLQLRLASFLRGYDWRQAVSGRRSRFTQPGTPLFRSRSIQRDRRWATLWVGESGILVAFVMIVAAVIFSSGEGKYRKNV